MQLSQFGGSFPTHSLCLVPCWLGEHEKNLGLSLPFVWLCV